MYEFTSWFNVFFHISIYALVINPFLIKFILSKTKSKKSFTVFIVMGILIEILSLVPAVLLAIDSDTMLAISAVFFYYFADFWTFWPVLLLLIVAWIFVKMISKRKTECYNRFPFEQNNTV